MKRIRCFLGRHSWRRTHYSTHSINGKVVYQSVTYACCNCGKNGDTKVLIDKRAEAGQ